MVLLILALPMAIAQSGSQTDAPRTHVKQTNELHTPHTGAAERKAILDILRKEVKGWSGLDVIFVVEYVEISNGIFPFQTHPREEDLIPWHKR